MAIVYFLSEAISAVLKIIVWFMEDPVGRLGPPVLVIGLLHLTGFYPFSELMADTLFAFWDWSMILLEQFLNWLKDVIANAVSDSL